VAADRYPLTAEKLGRRAALVFADLRELEKTDPAGAANLRATIAGEVQRWHALDAVPLEVGRG
jgi:hypothetical protein